MDLPAVYLTVVLCWLSGVALLVAANAAVCTVDRRRTAGVEDATRALAFTRDLPGKGAA